MQEFFFFNPKKVKLIKVNNSKSHILILYKILKERDRRSNISHKEIPTLEDHKIFIKKFPYRYWFIIKKSRKILGSVYITKRNEISITLLKKSKSYFIETINLILTNIKPLPAIASRRNGNFTLNLAPENKFYINILNDIGSKKIQETYLLNKSSI